MAAAMAAMARMAKASGKQAAPQAAPGIDEDEALETFRDPCWRLGTLYSIRTRDGSIIKFRPRPQQRQIIDLIYRRVADGSSS